MSYQDTIKLIKGRVKVKDVTVSDGEGIEYTFQIKKLSPKQYAKLTRGKSQNKLTDDLGEGYVMLEQVVCGCTVNPVVANKDAESCAENEISVEDLSLDILNALFKEIYIFSGIINRKEADDDDDSSSDTIKN